MKSYYLKYYFNPNKLYILLLLNILFNNLVYSYYIFPFKYFKLDLSELYKNNLNLSKEEIFLNYTNSVSIYTLIEIDNNKLYEMFFKSKEKCTLLTNDSCISDINNIPKNNYIYANISKIFEFINKDNIPNKCIRGEIGLALPGYSSKTTCFPMISEIKENDNLVKTQVWSIKYYNPSQNKDYDGEIIIGIEPHEYEPSIYNEIDYFTIYNHINEEYYNDRWYNEHIGFSLEFEKVYFYNISNKESIYIMASDSKEASLEFDLGMIKSPFVYFILIKEIFFDKYINLNICKEIIFSDNYHSFACDKDKLNIKVDQFYKLFPSIYFFSFHLNYTFVLTGKDLFLENDNKLYFMVFSRNENINNWRFGEIFLKKYFFTFNHESKKIGFYIKNAKDDKNDNSKNKNKKKNIINIGIIILIIGIILLILEIGFCVYCFNKKCFLNNRRKRANELNDDNYDYLSINK